MDASEAMYATKASELCSESIFSAREVVNNRIQTWQQYKMKPPAILRTRCLTLLIVRVSEHIVHLKNPANIE